MADRDWARLRQLLALPGVTTVAVGAAAGVTHSCVVMQGQGRRGVSPRVLAAAQLVARRAIAQGLAAYGVELAADGRPGSES